MGFHFNIEGHNIMEEYNIIQKEIESINQKYSRSAMDIISDYNNENKTKTDYKQRQIYELLQNADDCYSESFPQISVHMELRDNFLIIQNTGVPFSARGILSLMHTDASSKYEGTIGCKGLGFRSVLNWANQITIYTNEFYVDFSEKRAVERLKSYKQKAYDYGSEELSRLDRTAILTAAEVHDNKDEIVKWLMPGFSTAIVLYCDNTVIEEIRNQLIDLKFEELLFLKHINTIEIITDNTTRKIESIKENELISIKEANLTSQWRVWNRQGEIPQENGETKKYELIIAYNADEAERKLIRKNGVLYSYFKTDIPMSFPYLIHGTFELTSERNSLVKGNPLNKLILDRLIDFICEIGEELTKDTEKCDYEALNFLLPSESLGRLDREYDFTSRLKEKIKEYKVFPTINNEYISINESPKYFDLCPKFSLSRFDDILLPNTCSTLLKHADDELVVEFIKKKCGIEFYSDKEMVELINRDAQYYVDNGLNAELITLYYETFICKKPSLQIAPKILTDSKGNLILDENVKIFINPTNEGFDLPEWSKTYFLNSKLEESLSNRLSQQGRNLVNTLKAFNLVEYSFDKVLTELVSQSRMDLEKTKGTLAWLYEYWKKNNRSFSSGFGKTELRIISRANEIINISKCYVGKEYGNDLGERLTSLIDGSIYVGSSNQIGLGDKNIEDVKTFINCLNIKKYPIIETVKLDNKEQTTYIQYNSQKHPNIYGTDYDSFFSQWKKEICVSSIEGIDKILDRADFYDIVCWLLSDSDLYKAVTSENEISDDSAMVGKYNREVRKSYMRSWLRKIFTESKWLPTKSKQKVEVGNCTLSSHKLSPIVEVLDVDDDKLIKMSKKSKNEIHLLFEKLGIADDVADLAPVKIYEILIKLYKDKAEHSVAKQIYTKLNLKYKSDMIGSLISNNPLYDEFKKSGGVLAKQNGKEEYLPVKDVYYVDKKIYSDDILKNYPLLVLGKRAGASKIQKMFCVQPIQATGEIKVEYEEHDLNAKYQNEFQKILPYIYAKRIATAVDTQNKDFSALTSAKIILVKEASSKYKIGDHEQKGMLQDYELIYKDKAAYIKIPLSINNINDLKDNIKFRSAVAEVITTILDVDGDKDAFMLILACKSTKEAEEYFIENGDDDLSTVKLAKEKFSEQVDRKTEFWNTIEKINDKIDSVKYDDLMVNFNYNNPNSNCDCIIRLFKEIGISVDQYNQYSFDCIDLQPYYKEKLQQIKQKYRVRYFIYLLTKHGSIKTKAEFEEEKKKYDELTLTAPNSIDAQLEKIFENTFKISLTILNGIEGDIEELSELSKKLDDVASAIPVPASSSVPQKEEINYFDINAQIASQTSAESKKVQLSAMETTTGKTGISKKRSGTYDFANTNTKEENGFLAESKVYNTLCTRIGEKGSVSWVSGNGYRAGANLSGDDSLGYDIWYSDENCKKHYVEVKGSTSENIEFILTKNELDFAQQHAEEYEIWYVRIVDKQPTVPYELGNLLMLEEEETFFNNSKFAVENSEFRIRATAHEQIES